uniref:Uncharacterized protein n=1 Tax=Romanomermis culicivorax TaxID=13658 RepID=A0A915HM44_ROMCU
MWFDHELKPKRVDMPPITPRDDINLFIRSQDLINLHKLSLTLSHSDDSYVRELSVNILNDIILLHNVQAEIYTGSESLFFNVDESARMIATGLSDEANHVCLAACSAFIELWKFLKFKSLETNAYSNLFLPRLCLLRYCVAEGVRHKAADAWLIFADSNGQSLLEKELALVADYYAEKFRSENYMTRQCCCHASAEFVRKLDKESVRPLVVQIFDNLVNQLIDRSWEVRDSANLVCGEYVDKFPVECLPLLNKPNQKNALEFLFNNLGNDSYLVRSSAAQTLAKILDISSNSDVLDVDVKASIHSRIINEVKSGLDMTNTEIDKLDNPSNNSTSRIKWQIADGCIQLLAEMTSYQKLAAQVFQLIPSLISALYHRNYKEHVVLLDTMIRRLPDMIKNIGKQRFKAVLDDFIEPLFYSLDCGYPQITKKASDCMLTLSQLLGPSIWKAKIVKRNPEYGPRYDILMELLATGPHRTTEDRQEML